MRRPRHLFVDVSSHGFGHLSQVAPVLNHFARQHPDWRLTLRTLLPEDKLRERLDVPFTLRREASDFGYKMVDANRIDYAASAAAYREAHADWDGRVAREAALLRQLEVDAVLSDVAYLPLAGAAAAGIPALALSSLDWLHLFEHFFLHESWGPAIRAQIHAAYCAADGFIRTLPAMPMPHFPRCRDIGPVATLGRNRRAELGWRPEQCFVLVAFGGIPTRLPLEAWPRRPGLTWVCQQNWGFHRDDALAFDPLGLSFADLLCSVDAIVTKPGYGTFAEVGCNATPTLYVRRDDWPEQDALIDWLRQHGRCREISMAQLETGQFLSDLDTLLTTLPRPRVPASGAEEGAGVLAAWLENRCHIGTKD
ncbi:MAG: hypothetical protein RIR00_967 [Pseudomonadota bacterium]